MYKMIKYFIIIALVPFTVANLTSCNEHDGMIEDEWTATYVYLQRTDFLLGSNKEFDLGHSNGGISGNVSFEFMVKVQKASTEDIIVNLTINTSKGIPEQSIILSDSKNEPLPLSQLKIKAGCLTSDTVIVSIPDLSFMGKSENPEIEEFDISIEDIQTEAANTMVSTNKNLTTLSAIIRKSAFMNLSMGTPLDSKLIANRSDWTLAVEEGVEGKASNLIDGSTTDVARNNIGFWITVDLGTVKTVTGIKTNHWSGSYAPTQVEVFWSADGQVWKSLGVIKTSGGEQNITFISKPQTRFIKYNILGMPSTNRVDVTEFNVYEANAK